MIRICLAAGVAALLHTSMGHAQPASREVRTYTFPVERGPDLGVLFAADPGPGNAPAYSYVHSIVTGSPLAAAGLMVGDTVIAIDGRDVREAPFFPVKLPGTRYVLLVRRGSEELELVFIYPRPQYPLPAENPTAGDRPIR